MKLIRGVPSAWNYTYGPAYFYKGPRSLDEIYHAGEPVVVVADWIPIEELRKMELTRVRGFVLEQGTAIDDDHFNFFLNEKRAAVMGAKHARLNIREGEWIIVDGVEGVVCIDPTPEVLEKFEKFRKQGPPKRGATAAAAFIMKATMDAFFKKREAERAAGIEAGHSHHGHDHDHAPKGPALMQELQSKVAAQPSLISCLLQGVDIPRPPQAPAAKPAPRTRGRARETAEGAASDPADAAREDSPAEAHAADAASNATVDSDAVPAAETGDA